MLLTLPDDEFQSGLAELIKTAVIGDKELFELIENNYSKIVERDTSFLTQLVERSVRFKAEVVTVDEKENGLRRILNFGHTYGHAVEMYSSVKHGFAVASGMELATVFSFEKGLIRTDELKRILNLIRKYGLLESNNIPDYQIEQLIIHDKKKAGSSINFVFTEGIGKASVKKLTVEEVIDFYKRFRDKKVTL
jgi:3-dehydroquinate synthase